ncbi:hypothetical protein ACRCJW_05325 [Aerococcus urinaeequi]|uniref:hypothetical protein n=1 Tax=Aerococcus urinaeequi TaxID=51665 RepID=UPI003D6AE14A
MVWVIIVVVGVIISILMAIGDYLGDQIERDAHLSTIKLRQMKEQEMAQQWQQQNAKTDNDARISELEKEKRILELEKQIEELKK